MPNQEIDISENDNTEDVIQGSVAHPEVESESIEDAEVVASIRSTTSISSFSGPLPHPEILAQYDAVLPGLAERIVAREERRDAHDQSIEKTVIEGGSKRAYLGLASGTIVAIILILCGTFLVYNGHDWAGTTLVVATIVGLVGIFVYSTQTRSVERREALREAEYEPESEEDD